MSGFFYALLNKFLDWLWRLVNPDAAKSRDELGEQAKTAHGELQQAQEHEKIAEAEFAKHEQARADSEAEREASKAREKAIDDEAAKRKQIIDNTPDFDLVMGGVPRAADKDSEKP